MADGVIGFQHLREIRENEKTSDGLTEIDEAFFSQAQNYLKQKQGSREGENAATILEDVIDMRVKKMVEVAALHSQLAEDDTYEPDNLTRVEEQFYTMVSDRLASAKQDLLNHVLPGGETSETPVNADAATENDAADSGGPGTGEDADALSGKDKKEVDASQPGSETGDSESGDVLFSGATQEDEAGTGEDKMGSGGEESVDDSAKTDVDMVMVAVSEPVPEFLGIDLKRYGPYSTDETVEIPVENAAVLLHHGKAEKV